MTNQEKALMYDAIVAEGDKLNREKSKLKSQNAGINITPEVEKQISEIDKRLDLLQNRLNELIR
jgi:hypothetical protein